MGGSLVKQIFHNVRDFNLDHIFECGQCFRWHREPDGSYSGVVEGCFANISFAMDEANAGGTVTIWSNLYDQSPSLREKYWINYLDLGRDYGLIKRVLTTEDSTMAKAVKVGSGIRILNQNKWETLISFIISQNNNIPRIKSCIESLCSAHGRPIGTRGISTLHSFPSIDKLSVLREQDFNICRLGYRAQYIAETARRVAYDGGAFLETGDRMPTEKIEEYLLSLPGVGPKVANCILLFAMKKSEVFPIDVWMRRVMSRLYGMGEHNTAAMQDYARRNFGEYGGIAQQYLFYYIREMQKNDPEAYARLRLDKEPEPEPESESLLV
ncbi:MAG: 8-oxoguanine DNA glycosylase [Clostridiales Family XIII bacterium]|jgi:N-glycosylase/DNA lyase|nr:8-oxoguanine DNA glycosylase [Clostridiales Family XIII bacterium]